MKVDMYKHQHVHTRTHTLTQCLYSFSLLGAGFVTDLTADMIEGEENVMLLMNMDWQLNLDLHKIKSRKKFTFTL